MLSTNLLVIFFLSVYIYKRNKKIRAGRCTAAEEFVLLLFKQRIIISQSCCSTFRLFIAVIIDLQAVVLSIYLHDMYDIRHACIK